MGGKQWAREATGEGSNVQGKQRAREATRKGSNAQGKRRVKEETCERRARAEMGEGRDEGGKRRA
jgi:hypothetical protein